MKNHCMMKSRIWIYFFALCAQVVFFSSCEKDKEEQQYDYLVSSQKVKLITADQAKFIFSFIASSSADVQNIIDSVKYDTDIYRIVYKTTFKDSEMKASGIICVPNASGNFPLLSFQNGTNTLNSNAPSLNLLNPMFTMLQSMSSLGYIILMTDYLGFGESAQILHPYYHRESNDASVIDLIHACNELFLSNEIKALNNGKLFLMGYSQGAWATLSALKALENDPSVAKEILAASCGAGAYDMIEVAKHIFQLDIYRAPYYLPYFIESHIRNGFLNEPLQKYFNEPYASLIPDLFDGSKGGGAINAQLTDSVSLLVTANLRENFETGTEFQSLREELKMNSIEAWSSDTRLLFFHGDADEDVPPFESYHIYDAFIKQGLSPSQVQLITIDSLNHDTGLIPWGISTIAWFNELKSSSKK
jgi:predicted esterase